MPSQEIHSYSNNRIVGTQYPFESEILDTFFKTEHLHHHKTELVVVNSPLVHNKRLIRHKIESVKCRTSYIITIIDDSKSSGIIKIRNLLLRRYTVRKCRHVMAEHKFKEIGVYALYPTLDNLSLVYQTNSIAANYAEQYLFNENLNRPKKIVNYIFKKLNLGSPAIDIIAIVGFRI